MGNAEADWLDSSAKTDMDLILNPDVGSSYIYLVEDFAYGYPKIPGIFLTKTWDERPMVEYLETHR
jgi:hypothetical protein